MHAGAVEEHKALIAIAERKIAEAQIEMARAAERRDEIRARLARLDQGEDVPGGDKRLTRAEIIKLFGWTPSDVRHAEGMASLNELEWEAWFKEQCERTHLADRRISKASLRAFLRRRQSA
jgi:hypothetical protein